MKKDRLDSLWEHIEHDLNSKYTELQKENLYAAINNLPTYKAPDSCWLNIQEELTTTKKRYWLQPYLKLAAISLLVLSIGILIQRKLSVEKPTYYAKVYESAMNLYTIADTTNDAFTKLKNSTCNIRPDYCESDEFKQAEMAYGELNEMQAEILQKSSIYDNDDELETMLLKIETRKKAIQQELIQQLNQS
ncbi:MAG TPA: hypothetical protein PLU10_04535 [Chitinophagaceae bacterium]|nr:hypothetical protein [Chitinophagaceae bacterium]